MLIPYLFLLAITQFLSDDLKRRTQNIILDSEEEHPELRDFNINLEQYVLKHRSRLLSAALTVLHFWHEDGRPKCHQSKGSFQDWIANIGGIIRFAGLGEFSAADTYEHNIDPFKIFIQSVYDKHKDDKWKSADIVNLAIGEKEDGPLADSVPDNTKSASKWLGHQISKNLNRVYMVTDARSNKDLKIKLSKITSGRTQYYLQLI